MSRVSRHKPKRPPSSRRPALAMRNVELTIEFVGARGDGLARLEEDLVYVPFTVPGDRVLARIEGKRGDGLTAALIEVLQPGPGRATPPCAHFGTCGGCALQHLDDEAYTAWKRTLLVAALARAGIAVEVAPVVRIPAGTRRRAMFSFSRKRQTLVLGFAARASHTLVDVTECPLLKPDLMAALPTLRALLAEVVDNGVDGDVTVTLTENGLDVLVEAEARLDLFARERLGAFAEARDLARLSWRRPGTGMIEPLARRRPALVLFDGVAVEPPPGTFLQPSVEGEQAIARLVSEAVAGLSPVADLFSGCGSFTLPLARSAIVHAVEGEEGALRALKIAADHARRRVTVETRDLSRRPLLAQELKRFEAVVFDPPRAGAAAQAEMLAQGGPGCVVAVSCNPATLARDARALLDGGYGLERVVPIDQFPWAAHLEAVAVFRRGFKQFA